ncbi:hypothetical protein J5N97_018282 [Dioscorea zingiberensis]|uniref:Uncharacterized protein n=1 Tax=Dioscorea zingiberensis TaxID=325984 RepID=A0A9D5CPX2_9LILI|nr:hypothetical protein J5N97_018282 [Dioscorea zingiberensis]
MVARPASSAKEGAGKRKEKRRCQLSCRLVDHLRSHFPDYARFKLQPLSHRVHQAIQSLRRQPPRALSYDSTVSSGRQRPRPKADILLLEEAYLHRRRRLEEPSSSPPFSDDDDDDAFEEELSSPSVRSPITTLPPQDSSRPAPPSLAAAI